MKVERMASAEKRKEGSEENYEKVEGAPSRGPSEEEEGKGKKIARSGTSEVITVQWRKVAWVTIRDQVISPLLQGLVWYVPSITLLQTFFNLLFCSM